MALARAHHRGGLVGDGCRASGAQCELGSAHSAAARNPAGRGAGRGAVAAQRHARGRPRRAALVHALGHAGRVHLCRLHLRFENDRGVHADAAGLCLRFFSRHVPRPGAGGRALSPVRPRPLGLPAAAVGARAGADHRARHAAGAAAELAPRPVTHPHPAAGRAAVFADAAVAVGPHDAGRVAAHRQAAARDYFGGLHRADLGARAPLARPARPAVPAAAQPTDAAKRGRHRPWSGAGRHGAAHRPGWRPGRAPSARAQRRPAPVHRDRRRPGRLARDPVQPGCGGPRRAGDRRAARARPHRQRSSRRHRRQAAHPTASGARRARAGHADDHHRSVTRHRARAAAGGAAVGRVRRRHPLGNRATPGRSRYGARLAAAAHRRAERRSAAPSRRRAAIPPARPAARGGEQRHTPRPRQPRFRATEHRRCNPHAAGRFRRRHRHRPATCHLRTSPDQHADPRPRPGRPDRLAPQHRPRTVQRALGQTSGKHRAAFGSRHLGGTGVSPWACSPYLVACHNKVDPAAHNAPHSVFQSAGFVICFS